MSSQFTLANDRTNLIDDNEVIDVNENLLIQVLKKGWLPLPESVIRPERECFLWNKVPHGENSDPSLFHEKMIKAVEKQIGGIKNKIGVWFSGGIDSSTLLRILVDSLGPDRIVAFRIDFRCRDEEAGSAAILAKQMEVPLISKNMTCKDHIRLLRETVRNRRMPTAFNTQVTFAQNLCLENDVIIVLSALGLDEVQAGYPRHVNAFPENFYRVESDLLWKCQSDYAWNQKYLCPKIDVRFPFLDLDFVAYCRGLPREMKCTGRETKILLREVMKRSLPRSIIEAGRYAGSKGGFVPPIYNWWNEGLGLWVKNEMTKVSKMVVLKTFGFLSTLKMLLNGNMNLWTLLRVSSVPTFTDLVESGEFYVI